MTEFDPVGTYVLAYQRRYGVRPVLTGKVLGQIKRTAKDIGRELFCELIQVYLQMNDPWFKQKCHDIGTFLENLNRVAVARGAGVPSVGTNWSKIASEVGESGVQLLPDPDNKTH